MSLLAAAESAAVDSTAVRTPDDCESAKRMLEFDVIGNGCSKSEANDTVPAADAIVGSGSVMMDVDDSFISIGRSPSMALDFWSFVVDESYVALLVVF